MKHECKITVLETKVFPDLQEKYLADPKSGPCPFFHVGDEFLLERTPEKDDFYHLMNGKFCGEAWDAVSRLDERRPHDDRLLQRRHAAGRVQNRTDRHPGDAGGGRMACKAGLPQFGGGCLYRVNRQKEKDRCRGPFFDG